MIKKSDFLLNEKIYFFNNGSFGACPKVVFDKYQDWQRVIEYQPVKFYLKDLLPKLKESRRLIGDFIGADADDLILIRNATYAANLVIRSLELGRSDEVLITNHEYGACRNAWEFWQQQKGFKLKLIKIALPLPNTAALLENIKSQLTGRTRVIFFSHISSKTAQLFPAAEICRLAKEYDLISIVDGAHAVGHYPLHLPDIEPDFYFSNVHKWLFAPKGTAFLYTRKERQHLVKPLITSWGWGSERELPSGSDYVDTNQFYGTSDLSSFLTIPAAIEFYRNNKVEKLKINSNLLLKYFVREANRITQQKPLYQQIPDALLMAVIEVPKIYSAAQLKDLLYDRYLIEAPVLEWEGRLLIRISIQIFNTKTEVEYFLKTLRTLFLPESE